ncbi:PREDICTED: ultraviolet-B receptor UVR8-like [Amphimedon queenslandica]|uniref:FYVE-type domain-containing protein n=1 Tax=Amphimedon queenslandica TaxID=400682 RepID=A0A1X7UIG6_AMPQE|nr:PREDICTED: ultraviolet-B receptor UVR8-like [Amphimedon queenslandica]|eukprot:XP_019854073.1 PREDICTED: ultraviolet-B receptor UVR8-like [Amphimedon queenslandica]
MATDDEDKVLLAVCDVIKGSTLLKAGRSGKPHFRQFKLSNDLSRLMWESAKKMDAAVLISQITEIKTGQVTPVFLKNPIPQCEAVSFSLLYSDRSLDIVCKDKKEFDTWTTALKALIVDKYDNKEAVSAKLVEMRGSIVSEDRLEVQLGTIKTKVLLKDNSCDLYLWGGGDRGRLGHKDDKPRFLPNVVESLLGQNVTMIACGGSHTIALNSKGQVFSWGAGPQGCLGHGNLRDRYSPLMIDGPLRDVNVVHVACYENHSAVISEDGNLYTWGKAGPFLGYMDDSVTKQTKPRLVDALYGTRIVQVACGRSHTLVIDEEGRVYSFGINKFGELGQGHDKAITKPTMVPNLVSICKVSCGRHHSAAIDEDGVLFMWGWGARGQLGQGEPKSLFSPTPVNGFNDQPLEDVSCGYGHTAAITANGVAYCWGDNASSQCGVPSSVYGELSSPRGIVLPSGIRPTQINCGANFTVLVTSIGQLFTWGCNMSGQLGNGEAKKTFSQPMPVESLSEKRVKMVACGEDHIGCLVGHGWVPDEEVKSCMACKKSFTAIRRRHHCRQCGGIFCGSCSTKRYPLLDKGHADPVRVCDKCYVSLSSSSNIK